MQNEIQITTPLPSEQMNFMSQLPSRGFSWVKDIKNTNELPSKLGQKFMG